LIKKLKTKKDELSEMFDLKTIKPTKFLKLIKSEILIMDKAYTKVEQIDLISKIFDIKINYNTYLQFFNRYCKKKNNSEGSSTNGENNSEGSSNFNSDPFANL
jgi:hypothetical protein